MGSLFYRMRFSWDHRWTPGRMSGYLDGELAAAGRLRLERHVAECEQCRRTLAGLREMLDALRRMPALAGPGDGVRIVASVRQRLGERPAD
jgi:anti-sigma factor RsiW